MAVDTSRIRFTVETANGVTVWEADRFIPKDAAQRKAFFTRNSNQLQRQFPDWTRVEVAVVDPADTGRGREVDMLEAELVELNRPVFA